MKPNSQLFHTGVSQVVVAMSGGVDSSVAALLLQRHSFKSLGVSMQVWDYRNHGGCKSRATCCAPDDFTDARKVASTIGIPYYVFDLEEVFRSEVIDKFIKTYEKGETPNPCVDCNAKVKFKELRSRAASLGCSHVATGHYARIEKKDDGYHLLRAVDLAKDQSYFLYNLSQEELGATIFPIGDFTKLQVRQLAEDAGLVTASKPESQDICFVSGSVPEFLARQGSCAKSGDIVTQDGTKVGEHPGIQGFTVGQRKGLRIGGVETPLYVLELRSAENQVVVGPKEALARGGYSVGDLSWMAPQVLYYLKKGMFPFTLKAMAQVRHRHKGVPVEVRVISPEKAEVTFLDEWATISPGQASVFYSEDNSEVLGGGRISRSPSQFAAQRESLLKIAV